MEFSAVASYFNNDPVYDAYTGAYLFNCHSKANTDQTSAGATIRRRSMTTTVDVTAPARGVITLLGEPWLVGNSTVDSFQGVEVRRVWDIKRGTSALEMLTPAQACADAEGVGLYAQKELYKDSGNPKAYSDWDPLWSISVARAEADGARGKFLREGTKLYRIRGTYAEINGLAVLEADELDADARQDATFITTGRLDLQTDKLEVISNTLPVVQADSLKFYRYRVQAEADNQPGDRVVFVAAASIAPVPNSELTMMGMRWRVLTTIVEQDARVLRVRPV
jgi:hypothetical protein